MFRSFLSACGGAVALALVVSGLVVPSSAQAAPPAAPAAARVTPGAAWTPPAAADDTGYDGANVPSGPVPERPTRSLADDGAQARIAPGGTVVGAPGLGALPYFGFQEYDLSANMVARVNLGNGNLLLTANDATLSGPGLALRSDRFYNGLSTSVGAFGGGWSSSLFERDVRLDVTATTAVYTGANGFQATFTKSGSTWVAPAGLNATLVRHDPVGDPYRGLSSVFSLTFVKTGERTEFSEDGWLVGQFDRNGNGNKWNYPDAYEDPQREVTVSNTAGRGFEIFRDEDGAVTDIVDSAQRGTSYTRTHDSARALGRVDGLAGYWEEYAYDTRGRIVEIRFAGTGGATPRVTFAYDSSNRVTSVTQGQVGSTVSTASNSFVYDEGDTWVLDHLGNESHFLIDSLGRVSSTIDQLQRTRSRTWTANSDVATSTDALGSASTPGNSTTYAYDELGNQTTVTLPTGAAAAALYATGANCTGSGGTSSQVKCTISDTGAKTANKYDAAGNLLTQTDVTPNGTGAVSQTNTYQGTNGVTCGGVVGQTCSTTDGNGRRTAYAYDAKGNVVKVTPPSPLGATSYVYDSLGRVLSVVDGNQKKTTYSYDQRDQLVTTTWADGSSLTTTYASGLRIKEVDSRGGQRNYRYDVRGLVTYEDAPGAGISTYAYDGAGNMVTAVTPTGTVRYSYDGANQLTSVTEPGGSCGAGAPAAGSGCVTFEHDANGAESKRTFPGGATVATTADAAGRPTRITARNAAGAVVSDLGYSFSADGTNSPASDRGSIQRRTSFVEVGVAAGAVTSYAYDSLARVASATERSGTAVTASWTYAYDKAGNRTSQVRTGATGQAAGTVGYTYNAANQLTSSTGAAMTYTYDGAGAQTRNGATGQVTTFDSRPAVAKIGSTTYSSFGHGNTTTISRGTPSATWGTNSQGLTTETTAAGTSAYTRTPAGEIVSARLAASAASYFVLDAAGSVVGIFDKAGTYKGGYAYSPYGETRAVTSDATVTANPIRYIAGYYDSAAGLYKFGARYYDPAQGRFTQFDPSGQEANPYAYGAGDPVNNADPSGLISVSLFVKLLDAVLTGKDVYDLLSADSTVAGATAAFSLACGTIAGAIAAPTVAGVLVAIGGCAIATELFENALEG